METLVKQNYELSLKKASVAFMFAYQSRNVDKMLAACDLDGEVNFLPLGNGGIGKIGELGKGLWTTLIDCFPDIDNTVDGAVAEDDSTIKCQVVIRGTQVKDFAGIPNKGLHFESDHIFIFKLNSENQIIGITINWDHADFQKQLGM